MLIPQKHQAHTAALLPSTDPLTKGLDVAATNEALLEAYCRILSPDVLAPLLELPGRAGLFLPQATQSYCQSFGRIVVVDRAPKAWLNNLDLATTPTIEYVRRSTAAQLKVLSAEPRRHKFLQFMKRGNKRLGAAGGALGWAGLGWACATCSR